MDHIQIREYIYLARCGEADAYREIYRFYLNLARKVTHHYASGEYEIFARLVSRFEYVFSHYGEQSGHAFATYVYTCLKNDAIRYYHLTHKKCEYSLEEHLSSQRDLLLRDVIADETPEYNPVIYYDTYVRQEALEAYLEVYVRPAYREVMRLHRRGYRAKEIAKMTHFSETSIYNIISRLYKQFSEFYDGNQKMIDEINKKAKDI